MAANYPCAWAILYSNKLFYILIAIRANKMYCIHDVVCKAVFYIKVLIEEFLSLQPSLIIQTIGVTVLVKNKLKVLSYYSLLLCRYKNCVVKRLCHKKCDEPF